MPRKTRLVLTRRQGESITIGDAKVTIDYLTFTKVRLSIVAPEDVQIVRCDAKRKSPPDTANQPLEAAVA